MKISGKLIHIQERKIEEVAISIENGTIAAIEPCEEADDQYLLPGFIDAHIHIESSMLVPSVFAQTAVQHGTVATVSDPHEIANVLGIEGIDFMLKDAEQVPFHFFFGAPSCVPATSFETAGAVLDAQAVKQLLERKNIWYLSEMMNYPGVIFQDPEVMQKIKFAHEIGKPVDGHAPGLRGEDLDKYIMAQITTDHEAYTYEEAKEKLEKGMKIIIREGSAAKNFEALIPLLGQYYEQMMFCSDDKHPDDLLHGHINQLVVRALQKGNDLFKVLQVACLNPIEHYKLAVGQLKVGDPADFIVVEDIENLKIKQTYLHGKAVLNEGKANFQVEKLPEINQFKALKIHAEALFLPAEKTEVKTIVALDGELITETVIENVPLENGGLVSDPTSDVLKMVVLNRYETQAKPAIGFVKNFGFQHGAIASTVAHDSHNIVAVGVSDEEIVAAINALVKSKGGISICDGNGTEVLPLPIAGLMSQEPIEEVAKKYERLTQKARQLGSLLHAPFMTLSFMALPVIPHLKMTDLGLFDVDEFAHTTL